MPLFRFAAIGWSIPLLRSESPAVLSAAMAGNGIGFGPRLAQHLHLEHHIEAFMKISVLPLTIFCFPLFVIA
jgi:DNA-binding transcriptional LysR family regulator